MDTFHSLQLLHRVPYIVFLADSVIPFPPTFSYHIGEEPEVKLMYQVVKPSKNGETDVGIPFPSTRNFCWTTNCKVF